MVQLLNFIMSRVNTLSMTHHDNLNSNFIYYILNFTDYENNYTRFPFNCTDMQHFLNIIKYKA